MKIRILFTVIFVTIACRHSFSQSYIIPESASLHVGQYEEVRGLFFKSLVRRYKTNPDSALNLIYLSDSSGSRPVFVILIKFAVKESPNLLQENKHGSYSYKDINNLRGAEGKIVSFEGLPAIKIKAGFLDG